ncbi:MAG: response regulator [Microcoleaceae cyanobacterium]
MDANLLIGQLRQSLEQKPCILAVEDDEDNLLLINYLVESLDCRLIIATNGAEGLALAQQHLPNLILLNMVMPEMNGLTMMNHLKQNNLTSHIPVIAVTGLALEEEQKSIFEAGCDAYLTKPYMLTDLEEMIHHYLYQESMVKF